MRVPIPGDPRVSAVFSGRTGGVGNVSLTVGGGDGRRARADLAAFAQVDPRSMVFMRQVHGNAVAVVGRDDRGRGLQRTTDAVPGVDALVCFDEDVACVVLTADCVPVVLVDPGRAVAAVHAGRAGVRTEVVAAALGVLSPADPSAVVAALGPAIGPCCYEVPESLAAEAARHLPGVEARTAWDTPSLDLPGAVTRQLQAQGVERIWQAPACTRCASERYFSHRAAPGTGRQAGLVCRRTTEPATNVAASSLDWTA